MFPLLLALAGTPGAGQIPPPPVPEPPPSGQTEQPADPVPLPLPPPGGMQTLCPMWNRYFQVCSDCAGPGRSPFEKHPRVCLVTVCPCDFDRRDVSFPRCPPWIKEFSSAAIIPYPRFDTEGQPVPGDGLVIYEGMRLIVNPETGEYDLTFTATVPNMPVMLRMQLEFTAPTDRAREGFCPLPGAKGLPPDCVCPSDRYVLTLPPIRLQPRRDAKPGDPSAWTFHVAHRGYSTLFMAPKPSNVQFIPRPAPTSPDWFSLKTWLCGKAVIDEKWSVKRDAVARFGTPVAIEDPNR